jgi:AcrR family transcriptional regulator
MATQREMLQPARPHGAPMSYTKLKPGPGHSAQEVAANQRARLRAAMAELVEERGYAAIGIRELVRLAGVSTSTFYGHFAGKEDLLLHVYERLVQRACRQLLAAQREETELRQRLRRAFTAICREVGDEPRAARAALLEAPSAGREGLARMRRADRMLEAALCDCFAAGEDPVSVPPLVVRGIVAGAIHAMRTRLRADRERELPTLANQLAEWALACGEAGVAVAAPGDLILPVPPERALELGDERWAGGEREFILAAAWQLAMREGYEGLSVPRIRTAASVSRRSFDAHFEGVTDCFLAACEQRVRRVLTAAARGSETQSCGWAAGHHRALGALCVRIASQPEAARLTLVETLAVGPQGLALWERLIESVAADLRADAPAGQRPGELAASASVAAVWGVVCDRVAAKRTRHLPGVAPMLSALVSAPAARRSEPVSANEPDSIPPASLCSGRSAHQVFRSRRDGRRGVGAPNELPCRGSNSAVQRQKTFD